MGTMSGTRMRELRRRAGLSQTDLAQLLGVDTSLISRWEKGEREPSLGQQTAFARAIGVSLDYLLHGEAQNVQFLKRAGLAQGAEEKDSLRKSLLNAEQQIYYLDSCFNLAGKNPSPFVLGFHYTPSRLERIAETVRGVLRLNDRLSFEELKQALTEQNVFIFEWEMPDKISGLSYRGNTTVVFINRRQTEARRLFTLAHETAHLLFHLGEGRDAEAVSLTSTRNPQEKEANDFASELLMPTVAIKEIAAKFKNQFKQPAVLNSWARYFNVSPPAMFYRLASEKVYSWQEKGQYFEKHAALDSSPVQFHVTDETTIEQQVAPEFLKLALELYDAEKITAGKLAEWFFCSRVAIEEFLSQRQARSDDELWLEAWIS